MRRLILPLALVVVAVAPGPALAKNGVTPVAPKRGDSIPAGERPTFKIDVRGKHSGVFVHVCKRPRKDADGVICDDETMGRAKKVRGARYEFRAKFFDFPEFWLNTPGTYYWQAYRVACNRALDDCKAEGRVVKFKVA